MPEKNSEGETFTVPAPTIAKIDLCKAAAVAKMADKLEDSNWTVWCEKMHRIFKVTEVLPYIDGTIPCLDKETYLVILRGNPRAWRVLEGLEKITTNLRIGANALCNGSKVT
jgi:hypothetical protein